MLVVMIEAAVRATLVVLVVLLALKALRIRSPHIQMAAWQMVLAASLLMPFLVDWARFTVVALGLHLPEIPPDLAGLVATVTVPSPTSSDIAPAAIAIDWLTICTWLYLLVAAWLLLRLLAGCVLTWRLCRSASPVLEDWTTGHDVRTHPSVMVPSSFASTILLPPTYANWDAMQRRAVIAHEDAHVRRADFYVLALASIDRAVFWFNPMAWWLYFRIADLAEARSDAAAIQDIEDRVRYAEILVELASNARGTVVLAMARANTVRRRVERILTETILPGTMNWKTWASLVAGILPLTVFAAAAVVAQVPTPHVWQGVQPADPVLARRQEQARKRTEVFVDPKTFDNFVGYYQLDPLKVFNVTRLGDRLFAQLTGQEFLPLYAESTTKFFYKEIRVPAQISFVPDAQGRAKGLILHQSGVERFAKRIDEAEAKTLQEAFAMRVKEPRPQPGSEAALRRQIAAFQQGEPAYREMSEPLASETRPQLPRIQRRFAALGPLQSISYRGVGLSGHDVYEAKFENGMAVCRIYMTQDGKIWALLFQWGP
jgi:beta-lactamase regulating signal transducer with metallopeptidase domain